MKNKKYNSRDITKLLPRFSVMPDDKLKEIYSNIDWDDFRMSDVGVLCGELYLRGFDIIETGDRNEATILEFRERKNMEDGKRVA